MRVANATRSSAVGSALRSGRRGRAFESPLLDRKGWSIGHPFSVEYSARIARPLCPDRDVKECLVWHSECRARRLPSLRNSAAHRTGRAFESPLLDRKGWSTGHPFSVEVCASHFRPLRPNSASFFFSAGSNPALRGPHSTALPIVRALRGKTPMKCFVWGERSAGVALTALER